MTLTARTWLMPAALATVFLCAACEPEKGPAEKAGEAIDNAVDKAGDKIEEAGDKVEDAADKAKN